MTTNAVFWGIVIMTMLTIISLIVKKYGFGYDLEVMMFIFWMILVILGFLSWFKITRKNQL